MKKTFRLILLLLLATTSAMAVKNGPVYANPKAGEFLRDWLLCGPFPNPLPKGINDYRFDSTSLGHYEDYLMQYGGEGKIRPFEGMEVTHPDGHSVKWNRYSSPFGLIPLDEILTPKDQTIAYAACVVTVEKDQKMVLSVTSNDGIRIWQNGERILEHNTMGSEEPDRDLVPVLLKKGENQFCVKISQGFGKWSFQFRFLDLEKTIKRVEESAYLYTRPEITETPEEYQIFAGQRYKVELLNHKIPATITIMDLDENHVIASYQTNLGETIKIKKSELNLIDGLHPVACSIDLPNGKQSLLRNYIFVGKAPDITQTYNHFLTIPLPDTTLFNGQEALKNTKCLAFQLADDVKAGNLEPMDSWTQKEVSDRYEKWITQQKNAPSPYHKVYPEIQQIELTGKEGMVVGAELTFTDYTSGVVQADLGRIEKSLAEKRGISWKKSDHGTVLLGLQHDFPEAKEFSFQNNEAYRLIVDNNQIKVIGADIRGLHFGLVTLKQLLDMKVPLPSVDLLDYPVAAHRATFQYLPVPMTEKSKARILEYVDLKYNEIVVRSSDYRKMDDPQIQKEMIEYFDYLKSFQIEPIPLLWITADPSWEEGFFTENEPITLQGDKVELKFQRLVNIESSRPVFRSAAKGGIVYEQGKDYKIISDAPPVIERIATGRIPQNGKLFFTGDIIDARAHRFSKTCPSEELAYDEFDRLSGLIIKTLKPQKLHVNHDEIGLVNSDSRCKKRNLQEYQLVAYQINRMRDIIKKHDPKVDMIMWADCVNPYHNAGLKLLEKVGELLYKDIIMAHWFYTAENYQQRDLLEKGTEFFLRSGFRTYGSPWDHLVNHQAWERILLQNRRNPNFMGLMHTEWYSDDRSFGLAETGEVNWTGRTWLTK